MDLQQTIAELEKQAAQYTEAANSLRTLLQQEGASRTAGQSRTSAKVAPRKAAAKSSRKGSKKSPVSAETRAKISEALRASHAARKARSS